VNHRQQLLEGRGIARVPAIEQMRDVTHTWRYSAEF
jgi:hypothetical protein